MPLDAANHVRARADDQVGAGVDHGVGEGPARAPVLAEERLVALRDMNGGRALGARVDRDDDEVGSGRGVAHELDRGGDVSRRAAHL